METLAKNCDLLMANILFVKNIKRLEKKGFTKEQDKLLRSLCNNFVENESQRTSSHCFAAERCFDTISILVPTVV